MHYTAEALAQPVFAWQIISGTLLTPPFSLAPPHLIPTTEPYRCMLLNDPALSTVTCASPEVCYFPGKLLFVFAELDAFINISEPVTRPALDPLMQNPPGLGIALNT